MKHAAAQRTNHPFKQVFVLEAGRDDAGDASVQLSELLHELDSSKAGT
jgi:hypothetical protein